MSRCSLEAPPMGCAAHDVKQITQQGSRHAGLEQLIGLQGAAQHTQPISCSRNAGLSGQHLKPSLRAQWTIPKLGSEGHSLGQRDTPNELCFHMIPFPDCVHPLFKRAPALGLAALRGTHQPFHGPERRRWWEMC